MSVPNENGWVVTDPREALESLFVSDDVFSGFREDNNFKVLALEDAWEIDLVMASILLGDTLEDMIISIPGQSDIAWSSATPEDLVKWANSPKSHKLWAFRGRLLGKNSPHNTLPMPCFDFVREIWGDAWTTESGWVVSDAQDQEQIKKLTAQYNQSVVKVHTLFIAGPTKGGIRPHLGDIWSARLGKGEVNNTYNLSFGTAIGYENSDLIKTENWRKSNSTTDVYYAPAKEGCDSLLDLFDKELPPAVIVDTTVDCLSNPNHDACKFWLATSGKGNDWINAREGTEGWNGGISPSGMWSKVRSALQTYVQKELPDINFSVANLGAHRVLWESIKAGGARAPGSKHGVAVAQDIYLHTNLLSSSTNPTGRYTKTSKDNPVLAKSQTLTDSFIKFTNKWNQDHDDTQQLRWGGTFDASGGNLLTGSFATGRGIDEFHHWELTDDAVVLALEGYEEQLAAIGAPTPKEFADADKIEDVLLKFYKKLNDGDPGSMQNRSADGTMILADAIAGSEDDTGDTGLD